MLAGLLLLCIVNDAEAAGPNWVRLPISQVNDVAIDSLGGVYVTKTDGSIAYSVNGTFYIAIAGPPPSISRSTSGTESTTWSATRISIGPGNVPWVVFTKTVTTRDRGVSTVNTTHNLLYRPNALGWIEHPGSPDPADVTIAADGGIIVTSATAPLPTTASGNGSRTDGTRNNIPVSLTIAPPLQAGWSKPDPASAECGNCTAVSPAPAPARRRATACRRPRSPAAGA